LKEHLRGGRYESDDDVIQSVEDFLYEQDELFYQTVIQKGISPEAAETMD